MVIVQVNYVKPLEVIDSLLLDHRKFLDDCYAQGKFVCSGPRNPRTGGIILASLSLEETKELVAQDPFCIHGAADYQFIEFTPVKYDQRFGCFLGQ